MDSASKSLEWLPGFLIVAGLFFLIAGLLSDGPDLIGGVVFGAVSLAAAAAILYRRFLDERKAQPKVEPDEPGASHQKHI